MDQRFDITLYHVLVTDRNTGRIQPVNQDAPIEGRYKAEEQARRMERNNRDPNLHYSIERRAPTRNSEQQELTPEALLTHKFRAYKGSR